MATKPFVSFGPRKQVLKRILAGFPYQATLGEVCDI